MVTGTGQFPYRPFRLRVETWYNWQSGSSVSIHVELWVDKQSYSPSNSGCCTSWNIQIDSRGVVADFSGGFNFINGDNFLLSAFDTSATTNVNGDVGVHAYANFDVLGYTEAHVAVDGYSPGPPNAPSNLTVKSGSVTTQCFGVNYTRNPAGDGFDRNDQAQWSTRSDFATIAWTDEGPAGFTQPCTAGPAFYLNPGTTYYVRIRSHNPQGWSAWSSTLSQATLPAVAPGMTVTSTPSGLSATVTLSPPGGVSGVTQYNIEQRPLGTTTVTPYTTTTTSYAATGLTPGVTYEWRASANYGTTYTSPWTTWTPITQSNPSTSPGDYFDGSTVATADQTYRWTGTLGASTSEAVGHAPSGWLTFAQGATTSGGTGVVAQVSDPKSGAKGARVTFFTDATTAGFRVGTLNSDPGRTDVTSGASYVGTIWVKPSRSQRLAAELNWANTAGAFISTSLGTAVEVPAGVWTQLTVIADSPALAEWAGIRAIDVSGTGWSTWKGGDTITADAAMITLGAVPIDYFDGSFPDGNGYSYSWMGSADSSASIREAVAISLSDDLIDPDCPPVPLPPRPPIISDPCITDVGLWRRYYAMIPASEISDWLDVLPTFELRTYTLAERQVRIRIYPNPFNYPIPQVDTANWCAEQIVSYIPATSVMTLDGELQRTFASVSGGPTVAADHLLYGTGGTPATWPVLSCGMSYMVSFDTPVGGDAPPPGNLTTTVTLTRRT